MASCASDPVRAHHPISTCAPSASRVGGRGLPPRVFMSIFGENAKPRMNPIHIDLIYDGPYRLEISPTRRLDSNRETKLSLRQVKGGPLEFPVEFALAYTDRLGARRVRRFELRQNHEVREVADMETVSDPQPSTAAYERYPVPSNAPYIELDAPLGFVRTDRS